MVNKSIVIKNKTGLHLRPAGVLSKAATACSSEVTIIKADGTKVNPKSVLHLMGAGIMFGDEIVLQCEGETEQEDLDTLAKLIEDGLGE